MAPPSTRRPGFSRRAQYGLFLGYVIAVAGILFSVLLLAIALVDPTGFRALKGAVLDVTRPVTLGGGSVAKFVGGIGGRLPPFLPGRREQAEVWRHPGFSRRE